MRIALLFTRLNQDNNYTQLDFEGRESLDYITSTIDYLKEAGHEPTVYFVDEFLYDNLRDNKHNIDLAFNFCDDGFFENPNLEPHLPAMLDILKIPYTGGDYFTLSLTLRKDMTKRLLLQHNIPTPYFKVFDAIPQKVTLKEDYPYIVKPLNSDGSMGIKKESVVYDEKSLKKMIEFVIEKYDQPALVEKYIDGREFNVAVIGSKKIEILPISEISFLGLNENLPKIVNYEAKWIENSIYFKCTNRICPAKISPELEKKLKELSLHIGRIFGCQDYYRVDFRVDKKGDPYVLEINQNPDLSEDAGLAAMALEAGYSYPELLDRIIISAINRIRSKDIEKEIILN